ncbi:hypothetical protein BaRGS_00022600 [Batillaria attramentaria]|uniref:Uncharacterized protein n=1 Tax=Batillaria attramentaria TaxID=370345 RepID=A0ABD0KGF9_9CAEN
MQITIKRAQNDLSVFSSPQAKSPLMTLLGVRSASNNPEHAAELNLFIQAIIHGNVGITAFDIVTITKETILTIIGVVVSYFFVIIQFKIQ